MESELKDLNSKSSTVKSSSTTTTTTDDDHVTTTTSTARDSNNSFSDKRPLLKPDDPTPPPTETSINELEKKFAAYVRNDVYGRMGRGELPLEEKILLGLSLVTILPIRVVLGMLILFLYYFICRVCTLFLPPQNADDQEDDFAHMGGWRRAVIVACGKFCSRILLFVFGFYWIKETCRVAESDKKDEGKDQSEESQRRPGAIISNHVSYVDILYHMSCSFPSFVAKRSVAKLPLVGIISKCLGCVFVQRESKSSDFKGVSGVVTDRVLEAHQDSAAPMMMLFPEGTTTNGDYLLPFKTGAFLARAPVLPVILRYPYKRFSPAWDSISGARHLILLLCQFVNNMEVIRLPVYYPSKEEKEDPKLYTANVRRLMAREGNLEMSDIGLAEKRVYHAALNGNNSLPSVLHQKDD